MSAAPAVPAAARPRLAPPRFPRLHRFLRLLLLELRHNPMAWLLPVVIALFWLIAYRKEMAQPPLWSLRASGLQSGAVLAFAIPVTGAAAWSASREARRRLGEQLGVTARPRWERQLASWLTTTLWALAGYLGCTAVVYGMTAHQVSWGGPLWWPAAVGAASVPAFAALGFAVGALLPGRFTAPLVTVATFFALALTSELIHGSGSPWQISPIVTGPWDLGPQAEVATFYPFAPDLPIAQLMFLVAVTVALLCALALPRGAASRAVRAAAAGVLGLAVPAAGSAVVLAGSGSMDAHGAIDIPALHQPASDRPLPYTPVCNETAIPVCLHPAFAFFLPSTSTALAPLLSELAGLPGAPARIEQVAVTFHQGAGNSVDVRPSTPRRGSGTTSVSHLVLPEQLAVGSMTADQLAGQVAAAYGPNLVARVIGDGPGASAAQNAAARALLRAAGLHEPTGQTGPARSGGTGGSGGARGLDPAGWPNVPPGTPAHAAAQRFAALPEAARHAWLVQHLADLRAGRITPEQLP